MADENSSLQQMLEDEGIDRSRLRETLELIHPVDLAELLDDVDLEDRVRVFEALAPAFAAKVFEAMPHQYRIELVDAMGEERIGAVVDAMKPDVVADVIDHLPAHKEKAILDQLETDHRGLVEELREHSPSTAGGRMTKNYVAVPQDFTAGETIKAVQGAVTAETVSNIYTVDDDGRLVGVCGIGSLFRHSPETPMASFMRREVHFVGVNLDQEEVARIARKYNLRAVPVVDDGMRLVGVVTLASLLDVVQEEANEDVMKMAGSKHVDPVYASLMTRVKLRLPWLLTAMAIELLLSALMQGFESTLTLVALAYFIPIIMAMGGNVGLQSATAVVRGLATGDISVGKTMRVVFNEFRAGVVVGLLCGATTGLMAYGMHQGTKQVGVLALIVSISMVSSITIAATVGSLIPFLLHRLKRDPAVASGPFITAFNDMMNVMIYLTLATLLIQKTA